MLGLGLLGQITVQMLRAAGAVAIGVDVRPDRVARAQALGLDAGFTVGERDFTAGVLERTAGRGADAVIVTAAGGDPGLLNKAFEACRRKGRVVLVGDVPIRIQRDKFYQKELDFLISTSYGPGRYDPSYEEGGQDYPFGYVRWTEGRNIEEVLRQIASGSLRVRPLIDSTHAIEDASAAYASLASEQRPIGVLLDYHLAAAAGPQRAVAYRSSRRAASAPSKSGGFGVGVVGYGGYFRSSLLPLLRAHSGFRLVAACSRSGLSVRAAVENDAFEKGTTDYQELVNDPAVDVVYVATRHDLHYPVALAAVEAGKAVFVEKPMTTSVADGRALVEAVARKGTLLTVGFNRRFSPHAARLFELLRPIAAPRTLVYRVNAGPLPPEHWLLHPVEGGGRLLGEGVHFFDMLRYLAGAEPVRLTSASPRGRARDEAAIAIEFANGSVGSLVYTGSGGSGPGKERLEVFAGGASFVLDDYRCLEVHGLRKDGLRTQLDREGPEGAARQLPSGPARRSEPRRQRRGRPAGDLVRGDGARLRRDCALGMGAPDASPASASSRPQSRIAAWSPYAHLYASRLIGLAVGVVLTVLSARLLQPQGRGEFVAIATAAALAAQVLNLGLSSSLVILFSKRPDRVARYRTSLLQLPIVAGLAAGALGWLAGLVAPEATAARLWPLVALWVPPQLLGLHQAAALVALGRARALARTEVVGRVIAVALGVVSLAVLPGSVAAFVTALIAADYAIAVLQALALPRLPRERLRVRRSATASFRRNAFRLGLRAYPLLFLPLLLIKSDILMVRWLRGAAETGVYSVASQAVDILLILPVTIGAVALPTIVRARDQRRELWRVLRPTIALTLGLAALVAVAGYWPIVLVFGAPYAGAYAALLLLAPGFVVCRSRASSRSTSPRAASPRR